MSDLSKTYLAPNEDNATRQNDATRQLLEALGPHISYGSTSDFFAITTLSSTGPPAITHVSVDMNGQTTITPNTGSLVGLTVSCTGNSSGATGSTDFAYNSIRITNDGLDATAAPNTATFGLLITLNSGGANAKKQKYALRAQTDLAYSGAVTGGDVVGVSGWAISNQTNGGTTSAPAGTLYGMEAIGNAFPGATNYAIVSGGEVDAIIQTGASATNRWGWSIVGNGQGNGSGSDAAIEIGSVTTAAWGFGILLDNFHGHVPILSTGTVIGTDGSANTIGSGIDLSAYTITNNFLKGPGFSVDGSGNGTAASLTLTPISAASLPSVTAGKLIVVSNASSSALTGTTVTTGGFTRPAYSNGITWYFF